jgi:hypothetical protein
LLLVVVPALVVALDTKTTYLSHPERDTQLLLGSQEDTLQAVQFITAALALL